MDWTVPKIWQGGDVWIIGGGPSIPKLFGVPDDVIEQVHAKKLSESAYSPYFSPIHDKHVIGVNIAFRIGNWIDMVFFGDSKFFLNYQSELGAWRGLKVSCSPRTKKCGWVKSLDRDRRKGKGITTNPNAVSWNGNSGAAAINLAYHTGARRIFLLGFDMQLAQNNDQHWHTAYIPKNLNSVSRKRLPFRKHLEGFPQIARDARILGIEIYNVSPRSAITCLPVVTLEEAIRISNTPVNYDKGVYTQRERFELSKTYKGGPKDAGKGSMHKYEILPLLHSIHNPELYLEIGVDKGESIRLAKCKASGVNPLVPERYEIEYGELIDKVMK